MALMCLFDYQLVQLNLDDLAYTIIYSLIDPYNHVMSTVKNQLFKISIVNIKTHRQILKDLE